MVHKHFKNKDALGHVLEARIKGKLASSETHGIEVSGYIGALLYSAQSTAAIYLLLWISMQSMLIPTRQTWMIFSFFFFGWLVWNVGRSAYLGWFRLQRLNKLITEEKYEIEHHRQQEKEELEALYKAKGFTGKLLSDVVNVLMADDNRLLQIMLEEEMGLTLGAFEHPLKDAVGSLLGVISSSFVLGIFLYLLPSYGIYIGSFLVFVGCILTISKKEKIEFLSSFIWKIALLGISSAFIYFLSQIIKTIFLPS
ncbi:MAG: VIT1/CCC1 transporter family protein [Chlamydiota bacterium]|jgi:hypothetical protein